MYKRFQFRLSDVKTLEEGEEDDIITYSTSVPDEFFPYNRDFVRAQTYKAFMRIGKMPGGGTFLNIMEHTDMQTSAWAQKIIMSFAGPQLKESFDAMANYF